MSRLVAALLVAVGGAVGAPLRYVTELVVSSLHDSVFPWGTWAVNIVGSLARWALAEALPHAPSVFPWATTLTNATGCFALGVLMVLALEVWPPSRYVRPFAGVGVLGGYTTFSTAMLDTRSLVAAGRPALAAGYAVGTTLAGLGLAAAPTSGNEVSPNEEEASCWSTGSGRTDLPQVSR